ncbi:MAG: arsenate reductase ArsC [Bdellovibrionota bacterium]
MNLIQSVKISYFNGCPHAAGAIALTEHVVQAMCPGTNINKILIRDEAEATRAGFLGSPSIQINGVDIEKRNGHPSFTCRIYEGSGGTPPRWLIEAALLRAISPKRILFLCAANSARSQMAEGIARSVVPDEVMIYSAGSNPSVVNPLAVQALSEIGIDISEYNSKSIETINPAGVEAIITLCAEEICPAFFGKAIRIHWGLPDPAGRGVEVFKSVRDGLVKRISFLF